MKKRKEQSLSYRISETITLFWWNLPFSRAVKERIKDITFYVFGFAFNNTKVYQSWNAANNPQTNNTIPIWAEAKKKTILAESFTHKPAITNNNRISVVAVAIHVYYPVVLQEIIDHLKLNQNISVKLYVSSPSDLSEPTLTLLNQAGFDYWYISTKNIGRDIFPFLSSMKKITEDGCRIVLKLHTKKSGHLRTGELWRRDLYHKLLKPQQLQKALEIFNNDSSVGIIGPSKHIIPMKLYYGSNSSHIKHLATFMGVDPKKAFRLNFVAGTMFYARVEALQPLLDLKFQESDFEEEAGQLDGTLAHAIERAFAISTYSAGLKLVDTSYNPKTNKMHITKNYHFSR